MKKCLLLALWCGSLLGSFAQGTVTFNNAPTTLIQINGVSINSAQGAKAELLWAPLGVTDPNQFQVLGAAANVGVPVAGRFSGGTRTVPAGSGFIGIAPGASANFIVRAYIGSDYPSATMRGMTAVFTVTTGDPTATPAGTPGVLSGVGKWNNPLDIGFPPPPSINFQTQPVDTRTVQGSAITLTSSVNNTTGFVPTYQWYWNDSPLGAATNASLSFSSVSLADAGTYKLVVLLNQIVALTSTNAVLQVLPDSNAPSTVINSRLAVGMVSAAGSATVAFAGGFSGGFTFYTTDGSTPSTSSSLYTAPFTLTNSATIRAMSLSADFLQTSEAPPVSLVVLPVYSLATSVSGSGSVSVNPAFGPYVSNSVVTLTATAASNWAFGFWSGALIGSSNPATLTMSGPRSVQANFVPTAFPFTLTTPGGGTPTLNGVSIAPNTFYPTGSVVSLAATPASGWSFLRWEGTVADTANPVNVTLTQTQSVQAIFGTVVSSNIAGNGNILLSPANPVPYGVMVTNTALPAPGYYFVTWTGAATGTNNPTTFLVTNATPTVGALFAALPAPTITVPPADTSVVLGAPASFSVQATGAGPLSFQWRKGGVPLPSATTSNLFLSATEATDAGAYDVIVQNGVGNSITSSVVSLTILFPPAIAVPPTGQVVVVGSNATFSVLATGTAPLSYQWQQDGAPLSGATGTNYTLLAVSPEAAAAYRVVVSNPYGAVTSAVANLTVVFPPAISNSPTDLVVASGAGANFSVAASGTAPLSFQWYGPAGVLPDATNTLLTLNPALTNLAGGYYAVASNPYGQASSAVASLTVFIPVGISSGPLSQVVAANQSATFSVVASGYPAPQYLWRFNGTELPGATSSSLVFTNVSTNLLGLYWVEVSNPYSAITSSVASLLMSPSLRVPFTGVTAIWGQSSTLQVSAWGSGTLGYQWFKSGQPVPDATNATLTFPTLQIADAGLYSVVVTSPYGSVTNPPAQLVVNPANIELGFYASIKIMGVPGYTYGIESSTNLADVNGWHFITNVTLTQPEQVWLDLSIESRAPGNNGRYYRVTAP